MRATEMSRIARELFGHRIHDTSKRGNSGFESEDDNSPKSKIIVFKGRIYSWIGQRLQSGLTLAGFLCPDYISHVFWIFKSQNELVWPF